MRTATRMFTRAAAAARDVVLVFLASLNLASRKACVSMGDAESSSLAHREGAALAEIQEQAHPLTHSHQAASKFVTASNSVCVATVAIIPGRARVADTHAVTAFRLPRLDSKKEKNRRIKEGRETSACGGLMKRDTVNRVP